MFQPISQIFSEAFIEDPLFVCTFAQSAMSLVNSKQKIKSVKEEKNASVLFWCKVLQVSTAMTCLFSFTLTSEL